MLFLLYHEMLMAVTLKFRIRIQFDYEFFNLKQYKGLPKGWRMYNFAFCVYLNKTVCVFLCYIVIYYCHFYLTWFYFYFNMLLTFNVTIDYIYEKWSVINYEKLILFLLLSTSFVLEFSLQ